VQGQLQNLDPPLDMLPVLVRGGTILPQAPIVQNVDEVPQGPLELGVYPGPNCKGSIYQDDGNTMAYTRGEYLRMQFTCEAQPGSLRVNLSKPEGTYKPWWSALKIVVYGNTNAPHVLSVNGKIVSNPQFDSARKTVTFTMPASSSSMEIVLHN